MRPTLPTQLELRSAAVPRPCPCRLPSADGAQPPAPGHESLFPSTHPRPHANVTSADGVEFVRRGRRGAVRSYRPPDVWGHWPPALPSQVVEVLIPVLQEVIHEQSRACHRSPSGTPRHHLDPLCSSEQPSSCFRSSNAKNTRFEMGGRPRVVGFGKHWANERSTAATNAAHGNVSAHWRTGWVSGTKFAPWRHGPAPLSHRWRYRKNRLYQDLGCMMPHDQLSRVGGAYAQL